MGLPGECAPFAHHGAGSFTTRSRHVRYWQKFPGIRSPASFPTIRPRLSSPSTRTRIKGKWRVVFFWPKDFTFVCPTEIAGFRQAQPASSRRRDAQLSRCLAPTASSCTTPGAAPRTSCGTLPFPMLSDIKRELSTDARHPRPGRWRRAARDYIVDPEGIIRFVYVTDLRRPQPRGSPARARRAADRRAVPVQLEEGRGDALEAA